MPQGRDAKETDEAFRGAILIEMRAATIWLCLAVLWTIDAGFAFRRHDLRQASVAALVAVAFLAAGIYFAAKRPSRRS